MATTLAFDVYGTLIDPLGVATTLRSLIGDRAQAFAQAWREKQLEYLFRRALMQAYRDFPACTPARARLSRAGVMAMGHLPYLGNWARGLSLAAKARRC